MCLRFQGYLYQSNQKSKHATLTAKVPSFIHPHFSRLRLASRISSQHLEKPNTKMEVCNHAAQAHRNHSDSIQTMTSLLESLRCCIVDENHKDDGSQRSFSNMKKILN